MKKWLQILMMIVIISVPINAFAVDLEIKQCEYSDEYLKWLTLSDEERQNTIEPHHCKYDKPVKYTLTTPFYYGKGVYPVSYNLADNDLDTPVKNQMDTGSCWTFAANATVETYMLRCNSDIVYDLSERHMEYSLSSNFLNDEVNPWGLNRELNDGGNFYMASAYYYRGLGPIDEKEMPFENNWNEINVSDIQNKTTLLDIDDILITGASSCTDNIKDVIKSHIMNYGAVSSMVYFTGSTSYYNQNTASLYYTGSDSVNHAITIVGWDDNYSRDKFASSNLPSSNGAWIIKNSWGTEVGYDGYFYISYEDVHVCNSVGGIRSADEKVSDNLYMHDPYGTNSAMGLKNSANNFIYAANVYVQQNPMEELTEVMVSSLTDVEIEIYLVEDISLGIKLSNAEKLGSMTIDNGGYKTFKLLESKLLTSEKFAIIVGYKSDTDTPIGVSAYATGMWNVVTSSLGNSFISADGETFYDFKEISSTAYVPTIKVETNTINYNIEDVIYNDPHVNNLEGGTLSFEIYTANIANNEKLKLSIINSKEEDVTNLFDIEDVYVNDNQATVNIVIDKDQEIAYDTYILQIGYGHITYGQEFIIYQYKNLELVNTEVPDVIYNKLENELIFEFVATNHNDGEIINVSIENENGDDSKAYFVVECNEFKNNRATIILKNLTTIMPDKYYLTFELGLHNQVYNFEITEYIEATDIAFSENSIIVGNLKNYDIEYQIIPEDYTYINMLWQSNDENIAIVDQSGVVSAVNRGNTTITASFPERNHSKVVNVRSVISSLNLNNKTIISDYNNDIYEDYGGTVTFDLNTIDINNLDAYIYFGNVNVSERFNVTLNKENDDLTKLIIDITDEIEKGIYCVKTEGEFIYNKEVISNASGNEMCFEVKEKVLVKDIYVTDITLEEFLSTTIETRINPNEVTNSALKYESLNPSVVSVTDSGIITAKSVGQANIKITALDGGGATAMLKVTVTDSLLANSNYELKDDKITRIKSLTDYNAFINSLNKQNEISLELRSNSNIKTSGYVATGDILIKSKGNLVKMYILIVNGDVSKDGMVKSNDALLIERSIVNIITLDENQRLAADVSKDSKIATNDALLIKRYTVGLIEL